MLPPSRTLGTTAAAEVTAGTRRVAFSWDVPDDVGVTLI